MSDALGLYNYWIAIFLMMVGFYNVIASGNLVKKLIGLSIFQTSVFLLYITMGKVEDGTAPILGDGYDTFSNPLPHVLILTAIVVGIATTAVGLALVVRIQEHFGTIEEDELIAQEDSP
ncbi:MAG: cation:proton antiporter subunit C [Candidatus Latescibacterota bacterium]|nr:cation:proton antiporter subunit C [Candidatus Latescibacterota bacterium]MEC7281333.1 cation:proton antiporter subunit C [Verrucomicrobiota bacterium]MEE2726432.1 cation:proton antiporter subunit C [Candidatus Latescibacterota bacterium]